MNYVVEMRPAKEHHYIVVTKVPVDTRNYTVKGLREGAKYYFRVRAENIKGTSEEAVELDEPVVAKAKIGEFAFRAMHEALRFVHELSVHSFGNCRQNRDVIVAW